MDVPGFRTALVEHFSNQRLDVPVFRGRGPISDGGCVSVDAGGDYSWTDAALSGRGYRYDGELLQPVRVYTPQFFSLPEEAETEAYRIANLLIESAHEFTFTGLTSLTLATLNEIGQWSESAQRVSLLLVLRARTYGHALAGPPNTMLNP